MSFVRLFSGVTLAAVLLLTGCSPAGSPAFRRVAAKLNPGGTCYFVADAATLPAQMKFIFRRVRPVIETALDDLNAPFSADRVVAELDKFFTNSGLRRIQAFGQSSILLSGSPDRPPCFFHNRMVLDTAGGKGVPPFLQFYQGEVLRMDDFLERIPADALLAGSCNLNPGMLWRYLHDNYPIPEQIGVTIQMYANCPAQEFLDGLSGRCHAVILPPAEEGKSGDSFPMVRFLYEIPDRDNRLFRIIAKIRMVDPDQAGSVTLKLEKTAPTQTLTLIRDNDRLVFTNDAALPGTIRAMCQKGETLRKNPAIQRALRHLPAAADACCLENYRFLTITGNAPGAADENLWSAGCAVINSDGLMIYHNDYVDWNGCSFKMAAAVIPGILQGVRMAAALRGAAAQEDPITDEDCRGDLEKLSVAVSKFRKTHDALPAAPGAEGLRELLKSAEGELAVEPGYYVYFGTLPDVRTAADRTPLIFERPDCWSRNKLALLFADGHVETPRVPSEISNCEELISYLHTRYRYPEKDLNAFSERARQLDKALNKD